MYGLDPAGSAALEAAGDQLKSKLAQYDIGGFFTGIPTFLHLLIKSEVHVPRLESTRSTVPGVNRRAPRTASSRVGNKWSAAIGAASWPESTQT